MEKVSKKVHLLANDVGDILKDTIYFSSQELKIPIELNVNLESGIQKLPKDYDIYLFHLSQIEESDLKNIHNNQPWSYFVALSGAFRSNIPTELTNLLDEIFYIINNEDIERILKEKGNLTDRI